MAYNMGGPISEEEKKKQMMKARIAQSQVQQMPLGGQQQAAAPGQVGQGGLGQQIGQAMLKKALMSSLGPIGAMLPFNRGGRVGGPLSNPHGYNEGGAVMETPIKKVMDEQKLEQQAKAFELEQQRKQEAHNMAMQQKQQQFALAQKLKKESATTSKQAAKPKGPLGG